MEIIPLKIAGAFWIKLAPFRDHRGFFVRTYDRDILAKHGLVTEWIQESHSFAAHKDTVRGFHFQQQPYAETKLIRVVQGKVFMAILDIRQGSPTFGRWDSRELAFDDFGLMYVPKGVATGTCTLTDGCSLLYKMDTIYVPEAARTIRWDDPALGITWPLKAKPTISDKDKTAPLLKDFLASEGAVAV